VLIVYPAGDGGAAAVPGAAGDELHEIVVVLGTAATRRWAEQVPPNMVV